MSDDEHSDSEFYYPLDYKNNENESEKTREKQSFSVDDVQSFIQTQRPENTIKKTQYDLNVWRRYLSEWGETTEVENIPPQKLNLLICRFFIEIQKKDGEAYEPSTLTSFHRSLQRYLNDKQSTVNIFKDQEFAMSRDALKSKKKQLAEVKAKGNLPQAARGVTDEEEDLLFASGEFGEQNPESLQRTVWWLLSLHFGFRARDESRKLKWGDVSLNVDSVTGKEVLTWGTERGSKTRQGEGNRAFKPNAYASDNERCPVKYYKAFRSHRPQEMLHPDSPFYLAIKHKRMQNSNVWYCKTPLGKNEIGNLLSKAAKRVGLKGNVSNHSVRKTFISRLMDAGVPPNYVAQLSGHKNLKSLDSYSTASLTHQREMSLTLSRSKQSSRSMMAANTTEVSCSEDINAKPSTSTSSSSEGGPFGYGIFPGSSIGRVEGCSFTVNIVHQHVQAPKPAKRRGILESDDSESQ